MFGALIEKGDMFLLGNREIAWEGDGQKSYRNNGTTFITLKWKVVEGCYILFSNAEWQFITPFFYLSIA
jgi:hypothetical protein